MTINDLLKSIPKEFYDCQVIVHIITSDETKLSSDIYTRMDPCITQLDHRDVQVYLTVDLLSKHTFEIKT